MQQEFCSAADVELCFEQQLTDSILLPQQLADSDLSVSFLQVQLDAWRRLDGTHRPMMTNQQPSICANRVLRP